MLISFRNVHYGANAFSKEPFVAILLQEELLSVMMQCEEKRLTLIQKSGCASSSLMSTSCPTECAASMTVNILLSEVDLALHISTILRQGKTTAGREEIESIMQMIFFPLGYI
jgi:hypothetical protein